MHSQHSFIDSVRYIILLFCHSATLDSFGGGELCMWTAYPVKIPGTGVDTSTTNSEELEIGLLFQSVDFEAVRSQTVSPFSSFSPNVLSVHAAIRTVEHAAATMYISRLLSAFNSRASKLFDATLQRITTEKAADLKRLFAPFSVRGGGFVLLQAEMSTETNTRLSDNQFPVQRDGTGKKVRLCASDYDEGTGVMYSTALIPSRNLTEARRAERQYTENTQVLDEVTMSNAMITGNETAFPTIPVLTQDYRIIAGSVHQYGMKEYGVFCYRFGNFAAEISTGIPGINFNLPTLISMDELHRQLENRFFDKTSHSAFSHQTEFVSALRQLASKNKSHYLTTTKTIIDALNTVQGADDEIMAAKKYLIEFLKHSIADESNYILVYTPFYNHHAHTRPLDDDCTFQEMAYYALWYADNSELSVLPSDDRPRTNPLKVPQNGDARDIINDDDIDDRTLGVKFDKSVFTGSVLRVEDMVTALASQEFASCIPTEFKQNKSAEELADPTVMQPAFRPLVLERDNETRFKLSLLENQGYNPAYFGGTKATALGGVNVNEDRAEFGEDIKKWEFNLDVRDQEGYHDEWKVTMRTVIQVLISKARPPTRDKLPILDTVNLGHMIGKNDGFIYVPPTIPNLDEYGELMWKTQLNVYVRPTSQLEYMDTFPSWPSLCGFEADQNGVSAASQYWYNNAVATATEPFSIRVEGIMLDDVAAMIASSAPFSHMDAGDIPTAQSILRHTLAGTDNYWDDKHSLTFIQITKTNIAPGNSNLPQVIPPLRIHFKGAALDKEGNLRYTLGSEATTLVESMFITTALLQALTRQKVGEMSGTGNDQGYVDIPPTHVPMSRIVAAPFPTDTDEKLKDIVVRGARQPPHGMTHTYYLTGKNDGLVDLYQYCQCLGMTDSDNKTGLLNKAGRFIFGTHDAHVEDVMEPVDFAPGFYPLKDNLTDRHSDMYDDDARTFFGSSFVGTFMTSNDERSEYFHGREFLRLLQQHQDTYENILLLHILGQYTLTRELMYNDVKSIGEAGKDLSLPMYRVVPVMNEENPPVLIRYLYELVGFLHVKGTINIGVTTDMNYHPLDVEGHGIHTGTNPQYHTPHVMQQDTSFQITGMYLLRKNMFLYQSPHVISKHDIVIGLKMSSNLRAACTTDKQHHQSPILTTDNDDQWTKKTSGFFPLMKIAKDTHFGSTDDKIWSKSIGAYNRYLWHPRVTTYKGLKITASTEEIGTMLRKGCDGIHYGHSSALSSTVFAVAINSMYDTVKTWYEKEDPFKREDQRAVHVVHPHPKSRLDAKLLHILYKEETRVVGIGSTATRMVVPLAVEVRGPSEESLSTPCYVDHVLTRTANFRVYESQFINKLYERLRAVRRVNAVHNRIRGCLAEHLIDDEVPKDRVSQLIRIREAIIPSVARVMLQLKDYARIGHNTEQAQSNTGVGVAYTDYNTEIYHILFMI